MFHFLKKHILNIRKNKPLNLVKVMLIIIILKEIRLSTKKLQASQGQKANKNEVWEFLKSDLFRHDCPH